MEILPYLRQEQRFLISLKAAWSRYEHEAGPFGLWTILSYLKQ